MYIYIYVIYAYIHNYVYIYTYNLFIYSILDEITQIELCISVKMIIEKLKSFKRKNKLTLETEES